MALDILLDQSLCIFDSLARDLLRDGLEVAVGVFVIEGRRGRGGTGGGGAERTGNKTQTDSKEERTHGISVIAGRSIRRRTSALRSNGIGTAHVALLTA